MPMQIAFWALWFIAAFFAFYGEYSAGQPYPWPKGIRWLFFLLMSGLLGYKVFGSAIT